MTSNIKLKSQPFLPCLATHHHAKWFLASIYLYLPYFSISKEIKVLIITYIFQWFSLIKFLISKVDIIMWTVECSE